nr:peptidyl-Asp metalloendopeptidase {internal fragment} [Pseudomonas fragi, ATCC 4973, Peptide Partial, 16 aa] [Pseudomonas fragi]
ELARYETTNYTESGSF